MTCENCFHLESCAYVRPILPACDEFVDKTQVIEALGKQTPKKPEVITTSESGLQEVNCPSCHKFFGEKIKGDAILFHTPNYCERCSQKLDWSRE